MGIVTLLNDVLRSEDPYLAREQLDRIRELLIILSRHPDPEPEANGSTSFDPFTQSLNCVRGMAMHGIFHYSLYLIRQNEISSGQTLLHGFLEPEIQQVLEEKLDLSIEKSLAVHSVYGVYLPQLYYLSREWLEQHLFTIFPENEEIEDYWKAAWDAYISEPVVYRDVFKLLLPQYRRSITLLSMPQDGKLHRAGNSGGNLSVHLMIAYLKGLTDFNNEDMLLDPFFTNAPDAIRAKGIFWISQVLENDKPSSDENLWEKSWSLWQRRLELAETQNISQNTQEISEYMRWLEHVPVQLDCLYSALYKSIKYLHDNFDVRLLIEYASKTCDRFPLEAINLLLLSIRSSKEPWWPPNEEGEEKILKAALASENDEARRTAIEVINIRGEQGNFKWKYLLE
jgi:hypothetical protein